LVEGNQGQRRGQTVEAAVSLVGEVHGIGVKLMEVEAGADPAGGVLTAWRCSFAAEAAAVRFLRGAP
jgi:hypothetical protein